MNLFVDLQRRKFAQWLLAYAAGAWVLLQVLNLLIDAYHWPYHLLRVGVVLAVIGFLVTAVLAWFHGERGAQGVSGIEALLLVLLMAIGGVLAWRSVHAPDSPTSDSIAAQAPVAVAADPHSIAVLPFVNMSSDPGNQFFSDGISEELLNVLARVPGLGVASRTSSFAYKGQEMGAAEIARELKVSYILEGSVRKAGDKVRITAQLIDAVHDRHLWSETYDRQLNDIFAIQDEIANAIVAALRGSLTTAKTAPVVNVRADTENMQAYELYLKARENFIARRDLSATAGMFQRVVQLDPKFARGWEGLAAVSSVAPSWGVSDRDYATLAAQAADRALALDPSLSMPWAVRAQITEGRWPIDFSAQFADFEKAVAADPRNASALLWRGITWTKLGFFDRALADLDRAVALEPNYLNAVRHKALVLLLAGREDEAFALFDSGIAKGFVNSRTENFIAPMLARGRRTEALLLMGVATMAPELREAVIATLDHPQTPHPNARALAERLAKEPELDSSLGTMNLTHLYLWLGDNDGVGTSDDRVTTEIVAWDRYPSTFRNSPGMKLKLERMGVTAYWRAKGYPPQCRPVGDKDFTCD